MTNGVTPPANINAEPERISLRHFSDHNNSKGFRMLVLSRKKNETIVVDNQIEIEVLQIKGNTVRLGIKAPQSVKILRGELQPVLVGELKLPVNDEYPTSCAG
jgi:carbon storage regulator CsrA